MEKNNNYIKLQFSVFGDEFDVDAFTRLCGIQPSTSWKKGENIPPSKGLIRKSEVPHRRKETQWLYEVSIPQSLFFDEASILLLSKFNKQKLEIKNFAIKNNLNFMTNIVVEVINNQAPSLHFNKEFLNFVAFFNCEIDIDIYG